MAMEEHSYLQMQTDEHFHRFLNLQYLLFGGDVSGDVYCDVYVFFT